MREREHRVDSKVLARGYGLGRRDFMKMGVGGGLAMTQMLDAPWTSARDSTPGTVGVMTQTGTGWINDANRASGNGPLDDTSRQLVKYVSSYSESNLTNPLIDHLKYVMVDFIASLIAGFETEPARICARMARSTQSELKSTVLGYGLTTTPELAAFANACMLRCSEFDVSIHISDIIPGILAVGEALHSTGPQILVAVTLAYEVVGALSAVVNNDPGGLWDGLYIGPATALVVGKLMGMNTDQLANALSLSLVPHLPMFVSHVGALSMWKGCHDAEAVRCGIFAALLAREGMTGPSEPFEGRAGLWDHVGQPGELRLPVAGPGGGMFVQRVVIKRFPSEGSTQSVLELTPEIREWTKADDIASIHVEFPFKPWQEIADPPKWDPRNRETADHSLPYVISRALIDGDIYLDSFSPEKIMDPVGRRLMEKITVAPNPDFTYVGQVRLTVRTKAGGELIKETSVHHHTPMTHEEITAKFNRVCAFMQVTPEQRDRSYAAWSNLQEVRDIGEPMRTLAHFGQPLPL